MVENVMFNRGVSSGTPLRLPIDVPPLKSNPFKIGEVKVKTEIMADLFFQGEHFDYYPVMHFFTWSKSQEGIELGRLMLRTESRSQVGFETPFWGLYFIGQASGNPPR